MLQKLIDELNDTKEFFGSPMITIDNAIKMVKRHESDFEDAIKKAWEQGFIKNNTSNRYISDIEAQDYYNQNYKNE